MKPGDFIYVKQKGLLGGGEYSELGIIEKITYGFGDEIREFSSITYSTYPDNYTGMLAWAHNCKVIPSNLVDLYKVVYG